MTGELAWRRGCAVLPCRCRDGFGREGDLKARTLVAVAVAAAAVAGGAAVVFGRPAALSGAPRQHVGEPGNHVVQATVRGRGRSASMIVTDPYAAGSKLRRVEYHLHDGYTKRVIIPGGAYIAAEDIAICGIAGRHYPDNGFAGTGLPCKPFLHAKEIFYHQHTGDLVGRYRPHRNVVVTEVCQGHGRYLTFGHIDHGGLLSVEYYWANGEHLTVELPGTALVDHIQLIITGGQLAAMATRHP
jgi:hypothetical protein